MKNNELHEFPLLAPHHPHVFPNKPPGNEAHSRRQLSCMVSLVEAHEYNTLLNECI